MSLIGQNENCLQQSTSNDKRQQEGIAAAGDEFMLVLRKLWDILDKSSHRRFIICGILVIVNSLLEVVGLSIVIPVLLIISDQESIVNNKFLAMAYRMLGSPEYSDFSVILCSLLILMYMCKSILSSIIMRYQGKMVWMSFVDTEYTLIRAYMTMPFIDYIKRNSSELVRNIIASLSGIFMSIFIPIVGLVSEALSVTVILMFLVLVEPVVSLSSFMFLVSMSYVLKKIFSKKMEFYGNKKNNARKDILLHTNHIMGGMRDIRLMHLENYFAGLFMRANNDLAISEINYGWLVSLPRYILETIIVSFLLATPIFFVIIGYALNQSLVVLGLVGMVAIRIIPSASRIVSYMNALDFNKFLIDNVYDDIVLSRTARSKIDNDTPGNVIFQEAIRINNLSFCYPSAKSPSIDSLSIEISKGSTIAIIGRSGSGKTTLVNIIIGLIHPSSGNITVDSTMLDENNVRSWQKKIAYVPQDVFLIDDSLERNIAFGADSSEIDRSKLDAAIRQSQLDDLLENLPQGFATRVGERGASLSGGQRQRVGIARALYHDAEILVMDEATSALDATTEAEIANAIHNLHGNKTIIIIAHRLSTVKDCDKIFLLDNGKAICQGTFDELLEQSDIFREMVSKMSLETTD